MKSNFKASAGKSADLHILVFNCGSSSLSYKIFNVAQFKKIEPFVFGKAHRVGVKGTKASFITYNFNGKMCKEVVPIRTHEEAAVLIFDYIRKNNIKIDLIGHRFVHGGNFFAKSAFIDTDTLKKLHLCLPLAPIHNPIALSVIYVSKKKYAGSKAVCGI